MTAACQVMEFPSAAEPESSVPAAGGDEVSAAIDRARRGDTGAFAHLVSLYESRTLHFVLRIVGNREDAEDITQETFVKAWKSLPRYRHQHTFCTWLFTIARRTALNHLRWRKRRPHEVPGAVEAAAAEPSTPAAGPPAGHTGACDPEGIWEIARQLSPDQYQALWLCYGEDLSVSDIARVMNSNAIRIRVLLHRARKRLAGLLRPEPGPNPLNAAIP